jgi:hypothetical protein
MLTSGASSHLRDHINDPKAPWHGSCETLWE